jgi:predicted MFS family arabinose efflux permease
VENKILAVTTKAGGIKQYDFSGALIHEIRAEGNCLPWTVVSDKNNDLIYTDILNSEIVFLNTRSGERRALASAGEDESPYYRMNCGKENFFAASYDNILTFSETGEAAVLNSYSYSRISTYIRFLLLALFFLDIIAFVVSLVSYSILFRSVKLSGTFKRIVLVILCIALGTAISSFLLINETTTRYYTETFRELENVSRLMAMNIDVDVLTSLSIPGDYEKPEYLKLKDTIKTQFSELPFAGDAVYVVLWMARDDIAYEMYDLENSIGIFYPMEKYEGSNYQKIVRSGEYIHDTSITSEGNWIFVMGPIFDKDRNVVAEIETGYDLAMVREETQNMIIQTVLIVVSSTIALLLLLIECILILNAYNMNKFALTERKALLYQPEQLRRIIFFLAAVVKKRKPHAADVPLLKAVTNALIRLYNKNIRQTSEKASLPFRPELLRALIFFLFVVCNLPSAILPMYAANLYQPLFNLPRELVITLPFIADMSFSAIALLVIPVFIERMRMGIRKVGLMAVILIVTGNVLCFVAPNTAYLTAAYAFTGFAGGTLLLVINTIIGAQQNVKDMTSGFAHFNASYLAGVNVGVVFGSILGQFFPYRFVFLFSSLVALMLFGIFMFSLCSPMINYMYNIRYVREAPGKKVSLLARIFSPMIFITLFLLELPYIMSLSFTSYYMPIYGIEHGLAESNIGQLILLNGLFAILLGATLCEWIVTKISIKAVIIASLLLNLGAIYLFSLNMTLGMLVLVVVLLSIANIFAGTNIQTYYASLYPEGALSAKALSVYSAVENFSTAIGPVVFSYIAASNSAWGMRLVPAVLLVCLVLFTLISSVGKTRRR